MWSGTCPPSTSGRSEEHTSELQSLAYLVCRPPSATLFPYTTLFRSVGLLTWSWRMALITLGSVATSMIAALFVLRLGETPLNTITLLGLATAAALIVDDVVGDVSAVNIREIGRAHV